MNFFPNCTTVVRVSFPSISLDIGEYLKQIIIIESSSLSSLVIQYTITYPGMKILSSMLAKNSLIFGILAWAFLSQSNDIMLGFKEPMVGSKKPEISSHLMYV